MSSFFTQGLRSEPSTSAVRSFTGKIPWWEGIGWAPLHKVYPQILQASIFVGVILTTFLYFSFCLPPLYIFKLRNLPNWTLMAFKGLTGKASIPKGSPGCWGRNQSCSGSTAEKKFKRQIHARFSVHWSVGKQNNKGHTRLSTLSLPVQVPAPGRTSWNWSCALFETVAKTGFHSQWSYWASAPNPVCLKTKRPWLISKYTLLLPVLATEMSISNPWLYWQFCV